MLEPARDRHLVFDEGRARQRFLPGPTFEPVAAVIGLETGAIADEHALLAWDRKPRPRAAWERDQSLATAMAEGTTWFFQQACRRVGKAAMAEWLERFEYGNAALAGGIDHFWLQGGLRIGAFEQVRFLHRLAEGRLPATQRAQRLVHQAMVAEKTREYTLFARGGSIRDARRPIAWWTGWVERKGRLGACFALNCELTPAMQGSGHAALGRAILREAGALP